MTGKRLGVLAGVAVVAAAAIGAGAAAALTASGSPARTMAASPAPGGPGYSYYRSMQGRYSGGSMMGGSMMGGRSWHWMMGTAGYRWMMGGTRVPGWMRGGRPPAQVPAGAQVDKAARAITFTATSVRLAVVASPAGGPDETFQMAGMINPKITVPAGAHVTVQVVNADPGTAHGLVVTARGAAPTWMPMITGRPAFPGSALWFLPNPTSAGMHTATLTFTASTPGTYHYLCPVPGHAQKGMVGTFIVTRQR